MKIGLTTLLSLSFLVLHLPPAKTEQPAQRHRMGGGSSFWLPEDLKLTREQTEEIKSTQHRYLKDIRILRNELLNKRYSLQRLLSDPTVKSSEIKAKQKEVFALENKIQEKALDYQLRMREILTPQQFRLWVSRNQGLFGHGRHHRRGMGMMHP
jgi:Spy/CpxP family protein refolding chaperone